MQLNSIDPKTAHEKLDHLRGYLANLGSIAIAFSSGVDSTFLLKVAHDALGERCAAITVRSRVFPERESFALSQTFASLCAIRRGTADKLNFPSHMTPLSIFSSQSKCFPI